MIRLTKQISLKEIKAEDHKRLYLLMKEIYPIAYNHFWNDDGDWYVKTQYAKENILKELSQQNAEYYFILFNDEVVGNFRIIWDEKLEGLLVEKQVKLHRIYLHQKIQGKGVGKRLLTWLEKKAHQKEYSIVWLDAMDEQPQAFQFYKKQGYRYFSHSFLPYKLLLDKFRKMSQVYKNI
ncbi:GNAT family N-acetyltransferase [uncultured Polaribacter sp.]|mgnify:FL=1|uniref:GNAT family N-acetyltransferase n=1 Tax=uncultured Polaribacter sp. TaxID=174711 RepID=UPI00259BBFB2|nr:GNAT family N-acetyltransferase [uncultured Polaribacter sp.]